MRNDESLCHGIIEDFADLILGDAPDIPFARLFLRSAWISCPRSVSMLGVTLHINTFGLLFEPRHVVKRCPLLRMPTRIIGRTRRLQPPRLDTRSIFGRS